MQAHLPVNKVSKTEGTMTITTPSDPTFRKYYPGHIQYVKLAGIYSRGIGGHRFGPSVVLENYRIGQADIDFSYGNV